MLLCHSVTLPPSDPSMSNHRTSVMMPTLQSRHGITSMNKEWPRLLRPFSSPITPSGYSNPQISPPTTSLVPFIAAIMLRCLSRHRHHSIVVVACSEACAAQPVQIWTIWISSPSAPTPSKFFCRDFFSRVWAGRRPLPWRQYNLLSVSVPLCQDWRTEPCSTNIRCSFLLQPRSDNTKTIFICSILPTKNKRRRKLRFLFIELQFLHATFGLITEKFHNKKM